MIKHVMPPPLFLMWHFPAYPAPDSQVDAGLLAAVWRDGRVVRARSESDIGRVYVEGLLSEKQLAETRRFLAENIPVLRREQADTVPDDAGFDTFYVRSDRDVEKWSFVRIQGTHRTIDQVRAHLLSLDFAQERPIDIDWKSIPEQWRK